jgi:hypothetical protein
MAKDIKNRGWGKERKTYFWLLFTYLLHKDPKNKN